MLFRSEPDYDSDERATSIDEICDFFHDGDWNSRHDIQRLRSRLQEGFDEWRMNELGEAWDLNGMDYLRTHIEDNGYFDDDEAYSTAREEVIEANPELDIDSDEFTELVNDRVRELQEQFVEETWESGIQGDSSIYDEAQDEYNSETIEEFGEDEWLHAEGIRYMSDIENHFDVTWPHWNYGENEEYINVDQVADEFTEHTGLKAQGYEIGRAHV